MEGCSSNLTDNNFFYLTPDYNQLYLSIISSFSLKIKLFLGDFNNMSNSQSDSKQRANALADRIESGAQSLADFANGLSDAEWKTCVQPDGRTVGVIVHHVASVYPIEVELAQVIASGKPVEGVTWDVIAKMNAEHASKNSNVTKEEALELLRSNSKAAADKVRGFSDEELDRAVLVSLNADAPLTAQFFIEDHALRHSFHHLAKIKAALNK